MPFIYLESHLRNSKEKGRTQWWGLQMHFNSFGDVFPSENSLSLWIIHNFEDIKPSCSSRKNSFVNWESFNIYVLVFIILGSPLRAEWWVKAAKIILFPVNLCTQSYPLFATPWTVVCQAPLSLGFSRQYWSGLPYSPPGNLPNQWSKPASPALQTDCWPAEPSEKPILLPVVHALEEFFPLRGGDYFPLLGSGLGL